MDATLLRLRGISKKGRERIKQHGEMWLLEHISDTPIIASLAKDSQTTYGRKLFIRSVSQTDFRWISVVNDPDFEIVEGIISDGNT